MRASSRRADGTTITNALTIDVEDYFQVSALAPYIPRDQWDAIPCRVEQNVDEILTMLDEFGVHATFFTLGWIAERYPALVRAIADAGHEVASHGFGHQRAGDLSPEAFLVDVERARKSLQDISGQPVEGYRAPSFSIGESNLWAFDALARAGYLYSSSVYPIRHDHYGMPSSPRFVHRVRTSLIEIPVSTAHFSGRNWPASGGGYFRLLPYAVSRWLLHKINDDDSQAAVFYFHPWEIDPGQPRVAGIDAKTRFRHYVNLQRMGSKVRRLLGDFQWGRMTDVFGRQLSEVRGANA